MSQDEQFNSDDPAEMYEHVKANDPLFNQITRQMQKTMIEEGIPADRVTEINGDHGTFMNAYGAVKRAYFNHIPEETVARARHGGRDEWESLAVAMGLDRLHDEK